MEELTEQRFNGLEEKQRDHGRKIYQLETKIRMIVHTGSESEREQIHDMKNQALQMRRDAQVQFDKEKNQIHEALEEFYESQTSAKSAFSIRLKTFLSNTT